MEETLALPACDEHLEAPRLVSKYKGIAEVISAIACGCGQKRIVLSLFKDNAIAAGGQTEVLGAVRFSNGVEGIIQATMEENGAGTDRTFPRFG